MKSSEFITEAEQRISTGVGKTTVLDPSTHASGSWSTAVKILDRYSGDPMGIDLGNVQERHYDALSEILKRNKRKFKYIGWVAYEGEPDYTRREPGKKVVLTRFVVTAPGFTWEKYEGATAGGGRNTVYVGGRKMKLTEFLKLKPQQQDKLITLDPNNATADLTTEIKAKMKRISNNKLLKSAYWGGRSDYNFIEKLIQKPRSEWTDAQWRRIGNIAIQK